MSYITEKQSDLLRGEPGYSTPDFSHKEYFFRVCDSECDELVNIACPSSYYRSFRLGQLIEVHDS